MSGTEIRAEVLLCPDKLLEAAPPDPSWPRLAGAKVSFLKDGAPPGDAMETETAADGQATSPELDAGNYDLTVTPDAKLNNWTRDPAKEWTQDPPNPVAVATRNARKPQQIKLVPPAGYRLLALLLCGQGTDGRPVPLADAEVKIEGHSFRALDDGHVYALVPHAVRGRKTATVTFEGAQAGGREFEPPDKTVTFEMPEADDTQLEIPVLYYSPKPKITRPLPGIFIKPTIKTLSGKKVPLPGARVAIELRSGTSEPIPRNKTLTTGDELVSFPNLDQGVYMIMVYPPQTFDGWRITAKEKRFGPHYLSVTERFEREADFDFEADKLSGTIQTPGSRPLDRELQLEVYGPDGSDVTTVTAGMFAADVPSNSPVRIRFLPGVPPPTISGVPLEMVTPDQEIEPPPGQTIVTLQYQHAVTGRAVDESHNPMPGAVVILYDGDREVARAVAASDGTFVAGLKDAGNYSIAIQTEGGAPVTQQPVSVHSNTPCGDLVFRQWQPPSGGAPTRRDGDDSGPDRQTREAFTDLAAYPVLTEEVSTTGPPAPVAGGYGGGAAGAGYGQAVDQVIRDVLGWRPGGDVAGFQAALTGAFRLRDAEGHTEWTWQQRGYAVQADMGALTGAQASIYARAKAALDQIQPLLASVTALNPNLYPPEDLEAIRTVIAAEIQELVSELALEGGPRIQRVNELFTQLVGESRKSFDPNPDHVQGQLGKMRARFGLTEEWVETIDDERILTNFRVVVEQVLSLLESWFYDRKLLSVVDSNSSLGTILIWLSRGLEAVCESVDDLTFALDSVYVDAAQRQVIVLELPGQAPLLLSDLLDWYVRAARDEGPRLIQDAGRDGVNAFAPVLRKLQTLSQQTQHLIRSHKGGKLPDGMRTSRVQRAFQVLEAQLIEAARLAGLVEDQSHDQAPQISYANVDRDTDAGEITVTMTGTNFRKGASAFLLPADREDIADVPARNTTVQPPGQAIGTFRIPKPRAVGQRVTWQVVLVNEDGTQSNPADINIPKHGDMGP